jgi:hypothetical protein
MYGGVIYRIDEEQELLPSRSSLQCSHRLSEPNPESFDKLIYIRADWQEWIAQAIAC